MTITGKEMNHGEKSPQVYVKPEGIYIDSRADASILLFSRMHLSRISLIQIAGKGARSDLNDMSRWPTRRIVFPVTILSKRGSAPLILIMQQKEIKKSTLLDRKRVEYARQKDLQSNTPSYRS